MIILIKDVEATVAITEEDWGSKFTDEERKTIEKLALVSQKIRTYSIQPVIEVAEIKDEEKNHD